MKVLDANEFLASVTDRGPFTVPADIQEIASALPGGQGDAWPEVMTAAAKASGMLEECRTPSELLQAVQQFSSMLQSGQATMSQWEDSFLDVVFDLAMTGERAAQPRTIPSNPAASAPHAPSFFLKTSGSTGGSHIAGDARKRVPGLLRE